MCHVISIENVISNYFEKNKKKNEISFAKLEKYKIEIEKKFRSHNTFVLVEFYQSSLINIENDQSNIFQLKNDKVCIKRKSKTINENSRYFNATIPFQIRDKYHNIFDEVNRILCK